MDALQLRKRCVIAGLVSAKTNLELIVAQVTSDILSAGGEVVAVFVQRRGVSRSRHPGGAQEMHLPLNSRTAMSKGKVEELAILCRDNSIDVIVYLGSTLPHQIKNLSELTKCRILQWQADE